MSKKVIISGVSGMDGSNMVDYLLKNTDHDIFGMIRRSSKPDYSNLIEALKNPKFKLVIGDLSDGQSIDKLITDILPDYFINFAAQSFVGSSWSIPEQTFDIGALAVLRCLESIRKHVPNCRFYNAGCHDIKTRIMTPNGLKNYTEMDIGDLVYSVNPKTKDLEIKKITKKFEYDYNGEMLEFKKGGLLVTPNHRMFYKTKRNSILIKEAKDFINLSDVKYPINNPKRGKILSETTNLEEFIPTPIKSGNKNYGKHIKEINTYDLMYLIGLYIGDGSCRIIRKKRMVSCVFADRNRNNGSFASEIKEKNIESEYQCPQAIIDIPPSDEAFPKLISILNRNNIRWKLYGQCDVTFHQWGLNPYFSECGHKANLKHIPNWIFELDSSYQKKVLEGIIDSDGDKRGIITTCSKQLQLDIAKLLLNCGQIPSMRERPTRNSVLKDGRIIRGNFPEYSIFGRKENTGYQRGNYKRIPYIGKVWCFEVEDNHNFLVERNGKFTFSGNSSEQFGEVEYSPQDEKHPFRPQSPYAAAKAASHHIVRVYRKSYNLYAIQGLLFNHEGNRRGEEFVTRKITKGVGRINRAIKNNEEFKPIILGNIDTKRDWSDSRDFVDGIWRMLNQDIYRKDWEEKREQAEYHGDSDIIDFDERKDIKEYVLSSDETHTVREFIELAFKRAGIDGVWISEGLKEQFIIPNHLSDMCSLKSYTLISISPEFFRPAEVNLLLGDSTMARKELGWKPKYSFQDLVNNMVDNDL